MIKQRSITFNTLGCRLNQSETAVIQRTFEQKGYRVVNFGQPADIVVINTCTVTENGDLETRRLVNKVTRANPQTRIALVGCQAQIQKEKLLQLPNVRWVVGNALKMDLTTILEENFSSGPGQVFTPTISNKTFTVPAAGIDLKHKRANIKIQDGCDFFCSFCEIPYARGRARSRDFQDILKEANILVEAGHKELVITGINVGTYQENNFNIMDVINALEQISGLERIRISSIEPTTIPKAIIEKMGQASKLCRHLHIPLQSGNNSILSGMKRKYTLEEFNDFIQFAYNTVNNICIGTDIIVGFPGETIELFKKTEEYLSESPIHYFHVFSYSQRHLAQSRNLKGGLKLSEIQERSEHLRNLSERKRSLYHRSLIGSTQSVLFEHKKDGYWFGLTDNYVKVKTDSSDNLKNRIFSVQLMETFPLGLSGKLLT